MVSCWAEGLLRGGGEGMWGGPMTSPGLPHVALADVQGRAATPWWMSDPDAQAKLNSLLGGGFAGTPLDPSRFWSKEAWERELAKASKNMWTPMGYIPTGSQNMMPWNPGLAGGGGGGFGPIAPSVAPPVAPPMGQGP